MINILFGCSKMLYTRFHRVGERLLQPCLATVLPKSPPGLAGHHNKVSDHVVYYVRGFDFYIGGDCGFGLYYHDQETYSLCGRSLGHGEVALYYPDQSKNDLFHSPHNNHYHHPF